MKCSATITVDGVDAKKLQDCMKPELTDYERSSFKMEQQGSSMRFVVTASDAVALRATMSSLTQALAVYERIAGKKL